MVLGPKCERDEETRSLLHVEIDHFFILQYIYRHRVGLNRFRFLLESMQNLSDNIHKTNPLSQLLVVRGDPALLLPELFKRWKISHLVFEKDVNGYARNRDNVVMEAAKKAGVKVINGPGRYLWDVEEVVKKSGKPITSLSTLQNVRRACYAASFETLLTKRIFYLVDCGRFADSSQAYRSSESLSFAHDGRQDQAKGFECSACRNTQILGWRADIFHQAGAASGGFE